MNVLREILPSSLFGVQLPWATPEKPEPPPVPILPPPVRDPTVGTHDVPHPIPHTIQDKFDLKKGLDENLGLLLVDQARKLHDAAAFSHELTHKLKSKVENIDALTEELANARNQDGSYTVTEKFQPLVKKLREQQVSLPYKGGTSLSKDEADAIHLSLQHHRGDFSTELNREGQKILKNAEQHNAMYQFFASCLHTLRESVRRILGGLSR